MEQNQTQPQDIANLLRLWQQGDDTAFQKVYDLYNRPLCAYLSRYFPNRQEDLKDIAQQAWIKAISKMESYRHQDKFYAWLCRIAHNIVMDFFRAGHENDTDELDEQMAATDNSIPEILDRRDLEIKLEEAMRVLTPEQQQVIQLRRDDVPFKEIAVIQKAKLSTVLGRMHDAVLKIRSVLSPYCAQSKEAIK